MKKSELLVDYCQLCGAEIGSSSCCKNHEGETYDHRTHYECSDCGAICRHLDTCDCPCEELNKPKEPIMRKATIVDHIYWWVAFTCLSILLILIPLNADKIDGPIIMLEIIFGVCWILMMSAMVTGRQMKALYRKLFKRNHG